MLDHEYEQLVHSIERMLADGVQLVHGGQVMNWNDTTIPELLLQMKQKQEEIKTLSLESGQLVQHRYSGQKAAIINDDGTIVYLTPAEKVIMYPLEKFWYHYKPSRPGE